MIAALVPVIRLGEGKSRMRATLDRDAIAELSTAMLEDVVAALRAVPALASVAVVTDDPAVARVAADAGARALMREEEGLNPSLDAAAAQLAAEGTSALLVVLGDIAGAIPDDFGTLLDTLQDLGGRGVVLAPSRDGGTSALLRAPHDAIPSAFGLQSAARHRELARAAGLPYRELALPSLAVDLDSTEDFTPFLQTAKGGERTRALLHRLGWSSER